MGTFIVLIISNSAHDVFVEKKNLVFGFSTLPFLLALFLVLLFPCYTPYKTTTNGEDRKQKQIKRKLLFVLYGKDTWKANMTLQGFWFHFHGWTSFKLWYCTNYLIPASPIVYGRLHCPTQDRQDKEKAYSTHYSNSIGTNASATLNHVIRQGQGQPTKRLCSSQPPRFPTTLQSFPSTIQRYWSWESSQWCFFVS